MTKQTSNKSNSKEIEKKEYPSLKLKTERDIAMDFAQNAYTRFDKMLKAIILFGSTAKGKRLSSSDIDIILIVDDASIGFDEKLIVWYREELGKIIRSNPYNKDLHINTIKLTTWWQDMIMGDPTVINVIRYGEALIDFGGFFTPLKILLQEGRIKPTAESIHAALNRIPYHIIRSKQSEIGAIEGCFWAMIDSSQSLLMAMNITPPSYEHVPELLKKYFVDKGYLHKKYVHDLVELINLHKKITHGEIKDIQGKIIDEWQDKAEDFFNKTMKLIKEII